VVAFCNPDIEDKGWG